MTGGCYLNERKLIKIILDEINEYIKELEKFGILFEKNISNGKYKLRKWVGHSFHRAFYFDDHIGRGNNKYINV